MSISSECLQIPSRILWLVDLNPLRQKSLPEKVLKRIAHDNYASRIVDTMLEANRIPELFYPQYKKLIVDRADYRLDRAEVTDKILNTIPGDQEYKLLWFCDKATQNVLGGIIVHLLKDKVSVVFRCFDHEACSIFGFNEMAYYAEAVLRKYARSWEYQTLSHGQDTHPVNQVGLSTWKLRIGAMPGYSTKAVAVKYSEDDLLKIAKEKGVSGYYSDLVDSIYTKFHLYVGSNIPAVAGFLKVAENRQIKVIMHEVTG